MSDTNARASRFAFVFGSFDRKGLIDLDGAEDGEGPEGPEGAEGAAAETRGVGALDAAVGCGRGGIVGCAGARPTPGTFGAEGRGAGGGATGADGRATAGVGSGGVTARDPVSGVLTPNGATPGVGGAGAGVGARGGG
jgi:hypothetical protein